MLFTRSDPVRDAAEVYAAQLRQELANYPQDHSTFQFPDEVDWSVVFAAETEVLRRLPEAEIRRRAWVIYDRFADVAGSEKAARRAAANNLDVDKCDIDALRADVVQVHGETARILTIGYEIERERGLLTRLIMQIAIAALAALIVVTAFPLIEMTQRVAISIGAIGALAVAVALWYYIGRRRNQPPSPPTTSSKSGSLHSSAAILTFTVVILLIGIHGFAAENASAPTRQTNASQGVSKSAEDAKPVESGSPGMPIGALVAIAGIMGATFSILQRAQRSAIGTEPVVALFSLRAARRQAYLSIISGVISALVIFCIFAGGMVQGALFPTFVNKFTYGTNARFPMKLYDFFNATGPQTHLDHGKLLVWCFIAGFAERFVPDMLDRFTSAAKK